MIEFFMIMFILSINFLITMTVTKFKINSISNVVQNEVRTDI